MAGLLSKGITLGYKRMIYKHSIGGVTMDNEAMNLYLLLDNPKPITADVLRSNKEMMIGGVLTYESVGAGNTDCIIEDVSYSEVDDWITWSCSYGSDHSPHNFTLYKGFSDDVTEVVNEFTLTNLQEIAELGNNAPERIDVTVLSDNEKKSIAGLTDTAQDLTFKFLYEKEQFDKLSKLTGSNVWCVTLPDGTKATFTATASVKLAGVGVSAALSYTLTLSVESKIVFA